MIEPEILKELQRNFKTAQYDLPTPQILSVSFGENSYEHLLSLFEEILTTYYGAKSIGPGRTGVPGKVDYISFVFSDQVDLNAARRDWNLPEELVVGKVTYLDPQPRERESKLLWAKDPPGGMFRWEWENEWKKGKKEDGN